MRILNNYKTLQKQHDENDCAVACVSMILKHYQINFTYQKVREVIGTDYTGTNLHTLLEGVRNLGLEGEAYHTDCAELKKMHDSPILGKPFIAHTTENHFIVILSLKKHSVVIADPRGVKRRITYEEFDAVFSGKIIIFEKATGGGYISQDKAKHHWQLSKLIKKHANTVACITLTSLIILIIGIANSLAFQFIIDGSTGNHIHIPEAEHGNWVTILIEHMSHMNRPNAVFGILLTLCIIQAIAFVARGLIVYRFSKDTHMELLMISHERFAGSSIGIIKSRLTGEYLSRLNDIDNIKSSIASSSYIIVVDILVVGIGLVVLGTINRTLCAVIVLICTVYALLVALFAPLMSKSNYKTLETEATSEAYYKEVIECIELVKKTNAQDIIQDNVKNKFGARLEAKYMYDKVKLLQQTALTCAESVGLVIVLWIGYVLIVDKQMSAGELISFYMLASFFIAPMGDLIELQPLIQTGKASLERMFDILDMSQERSGKSRFTSGDICFNKVFFGYKAGFEVLNDLTLTIKSGESIAIQAPSGSGKTTFAKLLLGLYEPHQGEICIGGINIREICRDELRKNIGYIQQTECFFSGTIYENLMLGEECAIEKSVYETFGELGLDGFLDGNDSPLGLYTYIEENGRNLSSGQLQKLAIARAVIKSPKILILDEAVSNIEREDAMNIIDTIIHNSTVETLILITHDNDLANLCERKIRIA